MNGDGVEQLPEDHPLRARIEAFERGEIDIDMAHQIAIQQDDYMPPSVDSQEKLMTMLLHPDYPADVADAIGKINLWAVNLTKLAAITYLTPKQLDNAIYQLEDIVLTIRDDLDTDLYIKYSTDILNAVQWAMLQLYRSQEGFERTKQVEQIKTFQNVMPNQMQQTEQPKRGGLLNKLSFGLIG